MLNKITEDSLVLTWSLLGSMNFGTDFENGRSRYAIMKFLGWKSFSAALVSWSTFTGSVEGENRRANWKIILESVTTRCAFMICKHQQRFLPMTKRDLKLCSCQKKTIFFRSGKLSLARKVISKNHDQRDEKFTISHKVAALQSGHASEPTFFFRWWFEKFCTMKILHLFSLFTLLCLSTAAPSSSKKEIIVGKVYWCKLEIQSVKIFRREKFEIFLEIFRFTFSFLSNLFLSNVPRESRRGWKNVRACCWAFSLFDSLHFWRKLFQ